MSESNQATITRAKHDKQNPYVLISREMLQDKSISPKAKGILCYLLALPDDWQIYHSQLQSSLNVGEDYINSAMAELLKAGYANRTRQKLNGKFQSYHYEISESKIFFQTGFSGPENPGILSNERVISDDDDRKQQKEEISSEDRVSKEPLEKPHVQNETCAKIVRGKTIPVSKSTELMRLKNLHSVANIEDLEETWQRFVDADDEISDVKNYLLTILKKVCKTNQAQKNRRTKACQTQRTGRNKTNETPRKESSEENTVTQASPDVKEKFQRLLQHQKSQNSA